MDGSYSTYVGTVVIRELRELRRRIARKSGGWAGCGSSTCWRSVRTMRSRERAATTRGGTCAHLAADALPPADAPEIVVLVAEPRRRERFIRTRPDLILARCQASHGADLSIRGTGRS